MPQPFTLHRRAALLGLAALAATAASAGAAEPLSPEDAALEAKAVDYLENLTSAKGRFEQTDPHGNVSRGTIYLQRPGRARFEYDPPAGLVMTSDGKTVTLADSRLKTVQHYPLDQTPLSLFLARHIRLDQGVDVVRVYRAGDGFAIAARDARRQAEGQIALDFSNDPIGLTGWSVTDAQGKTIRVRLLELIPAGPFPDSLFSAAQVPPAS